MRCVFNIIFIKQICPLYLLRFERYDASNSQPNKFDQNLRKYANVDIRKRGEYMKFF